MLYSLVSDFAEVQVQCGECPREIMRECLKKKESGQDWVTFERVRQNLHFFITKTMFAEVKSVLGLDKSYV